MIRPNGISTLLACQNEEVTIGWSILSFLDFSDEIIVVDNGSTDDTKEICHEMVRRYPEKVKFYDVPDLKDLYENRQYALERSRYCWIVRGDADYICYTDGEYDSIELRNHLLTRPFFRRPEVYYLIQPNLYGDYWHSGSDNEINDGISLGGVAGRKRLPIVASAMPRVYQWVPGLKFSRLGRIEGARYPKLIRRFLRNVYWGKPVWMHCGIKSDKNLLYRSERTNWREQGDFERYPNLETYLRYSLRANYGTDNIEEAQDKYFHDLVLPYLVRYEPEHYFSYPSLVLRAMEEFPAYKIINTGTCKIRKRNSPVSIREKIPKIIDETVHGTK